MSTPSNQTPPPLEPNVFNNIYLQLFLSQRQSALMLVDALERALNIKPTTAEIRRLYKTGKISSAGQDDLGYNRKEDQPVPEP